jgi:hypothetical protein
MLMSTTPRKSSGISMTARNTAKYNATYLTTTYDKVKVDVDAEEKALRESWTV